MDKMRGTCKPSTACETIGEVNRRRTIPVSRGELWSARGSGVVRPRNTNAIVPARSTVSRVTTTSPVRRRELNLSVRSTNVATAMMAPTTPMRPPTPRRTLSLASVTMKSPVVTPRRRGILPTTGGSGSSTPTKRNIPSPTVPSVVSLQLRHSPIHIIPNAEGKAGKKEVSQFNVPFSIAGPYGRVAVVSSSAALWAANEKTGTIDVFSAISGKITTRIPARAAASGAVAKPLALMATPHHVWAGFDDGTVVVYDHLCVVALTMGLFHAAPVVAFCVLANGITVSGSVDMALVRWDKEENNFEAIARIVGVSKLHQALTCMAAFGADIVLCGSMAGSVIVVDCASGMQITTLRGHVSRVNALVVIENFLFSAAEDNYINIWNLQWNEMRSDLSSQRNCKLLKRVSVQVPVRDLVPQEGFGSLWVAYADGLVERWSTNPDDDFGVEQVVRESFMDSDAFQRYEHQRPELLSLHSMGTVETMRVLALGSNGISKVWCGHRNAVEESLKQSINKIDAVIAKDSAEASVWEQKALILKKKEIERKGKYCELLNRLNTRCLLVSYYKRWHSRINPFRLRGKQREDVCQTLRGRHQFGLLRRYFTIWCQFYDWEQRRYRRAVIAASLERLSHQILVARFLSTWKGTVMRQQTLRQQKNIVRTLLRVSNGVLLGKFFTQWKCYASRRHGVLPADKLSLLIGKSRQRVLRQTYEFWKQISTRHDTKTTERNIALPVQKSSVKSLAQIEVFAEAYAKVTQERERRRVFVAWRRWQGRRRNIISLRALAVATETQCHRNMMYRVLTVWQLFCRRNSLEKKVKEVQEVEKCLRQTEETHVDIFEKLQLQKRLVHLRKQHEEEERQLQEEMEQSQKVSTECNALRQTLEQISFTGSCGGGADDEMITTVSSMFFGPNVLQRMSIAEAMSFVMMRLKGTVINIYTDMPLFRQIKERLRCGSAASALFLEAFQEMKRVIMNISKKSLCGAWRCGERWPIAVESLEEIPLHLCATVLQAIKSMAVSYDMVTSSDAETLALTTVEIVANADLLFLLWRASYAARRPPLLENKRVASR